MPGLLHQMGTAGGRLMTAPAFYPKRFLLGANADLVNVDHVVRLFVGPDGKLFADMVSGPNVELVRGQGGDGTPPAASGRVVSL